MDTSAVLESIVSIFPSLPDESIEDQLVVFDALLNVSDPEQRPSAARLLKGAAEAATDPGRRARLLKASAAVAAGQPCAFTPDGLSGQQAAAAQTVSGEDWVDPVWPTSDEETADEDDEEEDSDDDTYEPPPKLPHLPVRHFFSGLVFRVAQPFTDAQGSELLEDDYLKLLSFAPAAPDGSFVLNVAVRSVRLNPREHGAIIENAGNEWLQPVPSIECLEDLCEAIELGLNRADEELDAEEEEDEDKIVDIDTLREDVAACLEWLQEEDESKPPPKVDRRPLADAVFGREHPVTGWIQLLYGAVDVSHA